MANVKDRDEITGQPGGAPIGSRHGGATERENPTGIGEAGRPGRMRTEREELMRNPDLNQADNSRGSQDQTQGSQTGSEIDPVPEP